MVHRSNEFINYGAYMPGPSKLTASLCKKGCVSQQIFHGAITKLDHDWDHNYILITLLWDGRFAE